METNATDHLETLRKLLPLIDVYVEETQMRYYFRTEEMAKKYEDLANRLIIDNKLPLVSEVAIWSRNGYVFEVNLVINYAPQMETISCY